MKNYGLIGKKLGHSFSPNYFNEKFKKEGINNSKYNLYETSFVSELVMEMRSDTSLFGLNVTIPYKREIIPFLDELSESANAVGAVNCIEIINSGERTIWKGHNTDYIGFIQSIPPAWWDRLSDAYILGSGGASDAIQFALKQKKLPFQVVSRTPKNQQIGYADILYSPELPQLFINTTPLGTFPNVESAPPMDYDALKETDFLYDLTYNPETTVFMNSGREKGCAVMNGYEMLKIQAEESWRIWSASND